MFPFPGNIGRRGFLVYEGLDLTAVAVSLHFYASPSGQADVAVPVAEWQVSHSVLQYEEGNVRALLLVLGLLAGTQALANGVDFTLRGIDGKSHRLSDFRGKWVVVNYWASWCPPCVEEMPELVEFHERHKDKDAVVLGVNMDEDVPAEDIAAFVEQFMVTYPVLLNEPNMTVLGPIPGLPTTFLVSPEGTIVAHKLGMVTAEGIESFIAAESKK